jgi:hypothetical protein
LLLFDDDEDMTDWEECSKGRQFFDEVDVAISWDEQGDASITDCEEDSTDEGGVAFTTTTGLPGAMYG